MKIIEKSSQKIVAEIITNRCITLDEALDLIGAKVNRNTLDVEYLGELYDWEDLDMICD